MTEPTVQVAADPFVAPGSGWRRVSPRLATARRLVVVIPTLVLTVATAVALVLLGWPGWALVALLAGLTLGGWLTWLIGRQVRAIGFCLRADDLLVVTGILFRRLVVVPFGRMQVVDVTRGPVDRWFGLASVQLHTAAATSDAAVPGLTPDDAAALRDRLAVLGEERTAGL